MRESEARRTLYESSADGWAPKAWLRPTDGSVKNFRLMTLACGEGGSDQGEGVGVPGGEEDPA